MKRPEFADDRGQEFFRTLNFRIAETLKVSGEKRYAIITLWKKLFIYSLVFICANCLIFSTDNYFQLVVGYLLQGCSVLLLVFNISHDAAHNTIIRDKKINALLYHVTFALLGNNNYVWRKYHNESHHIYTNIHGSDIDVVDTKLVRSHPSQELKSFHRYQHLYAPFLYLLYTLNFVVFRELNLLFGRTAHSIKIRLSVREWILHYSIKAAYFIYMIVLPVAYTPCSFLDVILIFFCYHFFISIIIVAALGVSHVSDEAEHDDAGSGVSRSWVVHQMITCVDYNPESKVLNWLLGGFNAHTVHHLLPGICHTHYPKLVPVFRQTAEEFGLPYNEHSYWHTVKAHFRFLKKMGQCIK